MKVTNDTTGGHNVIVGGERVAPGQTIDLHAVTVTIAGQVFGTVREISYMLRDASGHDHHAIRREGVGTYTCTGRMTLYPGASRQIAEHLPRGRKARGPEVRKWLRRLRAEEPTGSGRARRLVRAIRRHEAKLRKQEQEARWRRW